MMADDLVQYFHGQVEPIAEFHRVIRPIMFGALRNHGYTDYGRSVTPHGNMLEKLEAGFGDKFIDMTTVIRLASATQSSLTWYYQQRTKLQTTQTLQVHLRSKKLDANVFHRLDPSKKGNVIDLFLETMSLDLRVLPCLDTVQETMLHRHLYAHRLGLLDDRYIADIKKLTGEDILQIAGVKGVYPAEDVYWFAPLKRIDESIGALQQFLKALAAI